MNFLFPSFSSMTLTLFFVVYKSQNFSSFIFTQLLISSHIINNTNHYLQFKVFPAFPCFFYIITIFFQLNLLFCCVVINIVHNKVNNLTLKTLKVNFFHFPFSAQMSFTNINYHYNEKLSIYFFFFFFVGFFFFVIFFFPHQNQKKKKVQGHSKERMKNVKKQKQKQNLGKSKSFSLAKAHPTKEIIFKSWNGWRM